MPTKRDTDAIIGNMSKEDFEAWVELHRRQNDELLALDRAQQNYSEQRAEMLRAHEEEKTAHLEQEYLKQQALGEAITQTQDDAVRSQFAAQFVAEQQAGVAEAIREEQEQTKSRFIAEDQQRQEQTAEAGRAAEDQDKSRSIAEDAQRQAETAKDVQLQQDQARQQDAADTLRAELERGRSAAEAAEELGRSGVKVTHEQAQAAIIGVFDAKRADVEKETADLKLAKEAELKEKYGDGPDMEEVREVAMKEYEKGLEEARQRQLAAIAREEEARLHRERALYGRDDDL